MSQFISQPLSELLKELSQNAENEISMQLNKVCFEAIEKNREKIIRDVVRDLKVSVNATIMRGLSDESWEVKYKICKKEIK